MIKDQIMNHFKKLTPAEKMEVCLMMQLEILEETGADKANPALKEMLDDTLKGLRHGQ